MSSTDSDVIASAAFEALRVVSDVEHITRSSELVGDLGLDSLDVSAVLVEIEDRIGHEIPDDLLVVFSNIEERPLLVDHLLRSLAAWEPR
jgi:acyl carrier protein